INAADRRRDHKARTRLRAQHTAEAQLALAITVPGGRVEIAYAARVRGIERGFRLWLGYGFTRVTETGAAHAELRDFERCRANLTRENRVHAAACPSDVPLRPAVDLDRGTIHKGGMARCEISDEACHLLRL